MLRERSTVTAASRRGTINNLRKRHPIANASANQNSCSLSQSHVLRESRFQGASQCHRRKATTTTMSDRINRIPSQQKKRQIRSMSRRKADDPIDTSVWPCFPLPAVIFPPLSREAASQNRPKRPKEEKKYTKKGNKRRGIQ